jgi:hypothetical protein
MVKLFMCPDCHDKDSPWLRRELGDHFEVEDFGNFLVVTTNSDIPVLSNVCSCKHVGPVAMLPQSEAVSSYPPLSGHSVTAARQPSGPDRADQLRG